jgi:hypothetical protein
MFEISRVVFYANKTVIAQKSTLFKLWNKSRLPSGGLRISNRHSITVKCSASGVMNRVLIVDKLNIMHFAPFDPSLILCEGDTVVMEPGRLSISYGVG